MPKAELEPLKKVLIRIYQKDLERLQYRFGATIGFNKAVRIIVRKFLDKLDEQTEELEIDDG